MATQPPSDPFAAHKFNPLDIPTHLLERFEESPLLAFPPATMPTETGIYGLYLRNELVYIGKATGKSDLRKRFSEHKTKLPAGRISNSLSCIAVFSSSRRIGFTMLNIT